MGRMKELFTDLQIAEDYAKEHALQYKERLEILTARIQHEIDECQLIMDGCPPDPDELAMSVTESAVDRKKVLEDLLSIATGQEVTHVDPSVRLLELAQGRVLHQGA